MRIHDDSPGDSYFRKCRRRFNNDRMPRELTFSCYHQYPFLDRDRTRTWFVEALEKHRRGWDVDLWAWVIMPEHVHLIVAPRQAGVDIGHFVGKVKEDVARRAVAWLEEHSPEWFSKITVVEGTRVRRRFWQPGGGYDRNVIDVSTLEMMIQYLHKNPVRRGLVERAEDYEWSSAQWYAGIRPVWLEMDALPMLNR